MPPARAEGLSGSALRMRLCAADDPAADGVDAFRDLIGYAERLHGPLPGARALEFAGAARGLHPRLERLPTLAAAQAEEVEVAGMAREIGHELVACGAGGPFADAMIAGRVPPDLLVLLRVCALQRIRPTFSDAPEPATSWWVVEPPEGPGADAAEAADLRRRVTILLGRLTAKEERLLRLRCGIGVDERTLEEVGHAFGVTRERIRQIESRAITKLRSKAWEAGLDAYLHSPGAFSSVAAPLSAWPETAGPATQALAERLGSTVAALEDLLARTGTMNFVAGVERRDVAIERLAAAIEAGHLPGTLSRRQMQSALGCDDDVMAALLSERVVAPVAHDVAFGLGERFVTRDAKRIEARLLAFAVGTGAGAGARGRVMPLRRAAALVGYSSADAALTALSYPQVVVGRDPTRAGFEAAMVDCDRLAEVLIVSARKRTGADRRPWAVAERKRIREQAASDRKELALREELARLDRQAARAEERERARAARKVARAERERATQARQAARAEEMEFARQAREAARAEAVERLGQARKAAREAKREQPLTTWQKQFWRDLERKESERIAETKRKEKAREIARLGTRTSVAQWGRAGKAEEDGPARAPRQRQRTDSDARKAAHGKAAAGPAARPVRGATGNGAARPALTLGQAARHAHLPADGVGWLVRTGKLRGRDGAGGILIGTAEVDRFLERYVTLDEVAKVWKGGRQIADVLRLAHVPSEFPVRGVGGPVFKRGYVRRVAAELGFDGGE